MQQIQQPCNECEATGEVMNPKDRCKTCIGKKTISERKVLEVHIDKGMKNGQQIKFNGESDQQPGIIPGDVVIVLEEKEHPRFRRKGDDLLCEAEVDLLTALAGGDFAIEHLDDRVLHVVTVPGEVIKPGKSSHDFSTLMRISDSVADAPSCRRHQGHLTTGNAFLSTPRTR